MLLNAQLDVLNLKQSLSQIDSHFFAFATVSIKSHFRLFFTIKYNKAQHRKTLFSREVIVRVNESIMNSARVIIIFFFVVLQFVSFSECSGESSLNRPQIRMQP